MNAMDETQEVELLHRVWGAMAQGDLTVLERTLAPDARWHGVEDGQLCGSRAAILDVIGRNLPVVCKARSRRRSKTARG
jgi:hypothetical protein